MIIVLKPGATKEAADEILAQIEQRGLKPLYMPGVERIVLGALGDERKLSDLNFNAYPMVDEVKPILTSYKLVSRDFQSHDSLVKVGNVEIGGSTFIAMAGPCSVETEQQIELVAEAVAKAGGKILRGGAFKPRTSPYAFQGLGLKGLELLAKAGKNNGLPVITEVIDSHDVGLVAEYADALQIGARNMQNYQLLKAVGQAQRPVLLKRGPSATLEELLLAAEYILSEGNQQVMLCERGIRTYENAYRNTLDLNAVAYLKLKTHLPVIVDPSHGTGVHDLVAPLTLAAAAVGADGVIVEVHPEPKNALSDAQQQLRPEEFARLTQKLQQVLTAVGREF
ncbi:MAG: 3-deoxy-7-phosphoheptulonate synthase [Gammaproteobacteria bacterium CG22_combo_CG10-13_8_21_14_all_40_8]|nr:MAG: 3-deoxy-7-phosphoheptulonate synthase [Gammaproteobacteria bacterium CG22_combo_CG10-13_8_21_14_all_40_8]